MKIGFRWCREGFRTCLIEYNSVILESLNTFQTVEEAMEYGSFLFFITRKYRK